MDRTLNSYGLDEKLIKLVKQCPILYDYNNPRYTDFNEREVAWQKIGDILNRSASGCKSRWINIRDMNRRILKKVIKEPTTGNNRRRLYKYSRQLEFMAPFYRDVELKNFYETNTIITIKPEGNSSNDAEVEVVENPLGNFEVESNVSGDELKEADSESTIFQSEDDAGVESEENDCYFSEEDHELKNIRLNKTKPTNNRIEMKSKERQQQPSFLVASSSSSNEPSTNEDLDAFLLSIGTTMSKFSPYHLNIAKRKIFNIVQHHELLQIKRKRKNI